MPFTSGQIAKFRSTPHTGEVITGAVGTLSNAPVQPGTLQIHYTIGSVSYTGYDKFRNGEFKGFDAGVTLNCQGTIDYATGAWTVTWPQGAPTGTVTVDYMEPTSILETLLNHVCGHFYDQEVVDNTPDGIKTAFSGTLAHFPDISKGHVEFSFTVNGKIFSPETGNPARDDGAGAISGIDLDTDPDTTICTGAIDYATGAWTLAFTTGNAPDAGTSILCDYVIGPPGQDWKVMGMAVADYVQPRCQVILKNTGVSGQEDVFIGLMERTALGVNAYHWHLNIYKTVSKGERSFAVNNGETGKTAYNGTWDSYTQYPMMPLWDNVMDYWWYSNKQRIFGVVNITGSYESFYLGFGKRFGQPSTYNFPAIASGSLFGTRNYGNTEVYHRWCINPYYYSNQHDYAVMGIMPDGTYTYTGGYAPKPLIFIPTYDFTEASPVATMTAGEVLIHPVYVTEESGGSVLMELDDVFYCPCNQLSVEDTISIGGDTYKVFRNIGNNNYYDFMCVKEG